MRLGALLLVLVSVACGGGAAAPPPVVVDPTHQVTLALADAVKLIRARRFDDAERRLAQERQVAALDPNELEKLDYYLATVMAYRGELQRAQQLIRAHALSARSRGDEDSEAWMQSCSAWLRWAGNDGAGAAAENRRIGDIAGEGMDTMDRRALLLQQMWDQAFFLIEHAATVGDEERQAALERARDARDAYDTLAREPDEHDEIQLLAAYFSWRTGDTATARRALEGIGAEQHDDARGLYVLSVVLEAAGDQAEAAKARTRLRSTINLLAPLLERAAEKRISGASSSPS